MTGWPARRPQLSPVSGLRLRHRRDFKRLPVLGIGASPSDIVEERAKGRIMGNRWSTITFVIVLLALSAGLVRVGWIADHQREALAQLGEEDRQLRRELAAAQRSVHELEERVGLLATLAAERPLADSVTALQEAVGDRSLGYRSRGGYSFSGTNLWDEVEGIGRELDDLRGCVESIANVIRFNYSFVFC